MKAKAASESTYYKLWDLERELSVSRATIYRWCRKGLVEHIKLPSGHIRIPAEEVKKLKRELR